MSDSLKLVSTFRAVLGGGGRPGIEGRAFFNAAIERSGAAKPRILVVATAKASEKSHNDSVAEITTAYGKLAHDVKSLHAFGETPTALHVVSSFSWADVVYFCGGDTPRLVKLMNELGVVDEIIRAFTRPDANRVACGISAGTLCWFDRGQSDTQSYNLAKPEDSWDYELVPGWSLLPAVGGVHYNRFHPQTCYPRSLDFHDDMMRQPIDTIGLAVTNQAAWKFADGMVSIIDSESTGQGFRLVRKSAWTGGGLDITAFAESDGGIPVAELFATPTPPSPGT